MTTTTPPHSLRTATEADTVPHPPAGAPELHEHSADRPRRRDGDLLLTGRAEFLDDVAPPGLLHAAILRSPHPHAQIRSVDTSAAEALPGVRAVLTGERAAQLATPVPHFFDPAVLGYNSAEFPVLATHAVRWVGDPVAAVAADTLADAEAALAAIHVDYEVLPAVLDAEEALRPGAPLLFEEWGENVIGRFPFVEGDASGRIEGAPHRLSGELRVGRHQCAPMETRGYIGSWGRGGRITFWASTQNPHPLRSNLSTVLGVPEDRIRVIAPQVGGGFGHKFNGYAEEPVVCLLSRLAGAPVKWLETRAESLLVGAREFVHRFEVGFDDDGVVVGLRNRMLGNVGSLATWGGWPMCFSGGMTFPGPYAIADYDIESIPVVTNKAPWNGYRGYGKEQAALVLERAMDLVAGRLGLDPAEVRRRNFLPPDAFPHWTVAKHVDSGDYAGALDKLLELAGYDGLRADRDAAREQGRHVGVGIGFELTPEGGDFAGSFVRGYDTSTVRVHPTGGVTVLTGVTSPGSGNETSIAYLVARELGLRVEQVDVIQGDTDACPYGYGNFSSRSLATGGAAAVLAARDVRDRMAAAAATLLECAPGDLVFADGSVHPADRPDHALPFTELAVTIYKRGFAAPGIDNPLLESTRVDMPHNFHHVPDEQGRFSAYPSFAFSAHLAVVEVDVETGVVDVRRFFSVGDCGVVVNPHFVDGQMHGAVAQGIGGALWEDLPYEDAGHPEAQTFKHYLTPRAPDLPAIRVAHQETPSPYTLLGTKGAGESGVGGAMAAITNAVNDAVAPLGVRAHHLPLNPPHVLAAITEGATR